MIFCYRVQGHIGRNKTCRSPVWNSWLLGYQQRTRSLDFISCIIDNVITWNIAKARSGRRVWRSFFQVGRPLKNNLASLLLYLENWMYLDLQVSPAIGQQTMVELTFKTPLVLTFFIFSCCLFVFLALQPFWLYFSQSRNGL